MSGWRIRWSSAGRAAAIAVAALAALAVLPSLLGGSEPPPLPADVGLAPAATPAPPPVAEQPVGSSASGQAAVPTEAGQGEEEVEQDRLVEPQSGVDAARRQVDRDPESPPISTPPLSAPVYAYPLAPTPPEFGFER